TDVKVDRTAAVAQEETRIVKGRPGRYQSSAFGFHTDNLRVAVASFYCIEQDAVDGALLLLDTSDLGNYFSAREIEMLSEVELWAPGLESKTSHEDFFYLSPLLTKVSRGYLIYYAPWMLQESYDRPFSQVVEKFAAYVRHKEAADVIRVPFQKG